MIALNDLCVLDVPVKSMLQSNFVATALSKISNIPVNAKSFFKEAFNAGLLCPTIKVTDKQTTFNFGIDHKYVVFTISNLREQSLILFTYGSLGTEPRYGTIVDSGRQLATLSEFLYPKSKVAT